jgi:hypothetical protein
MISRATHSVIFIARSAPRPVGYTLAFLPALPAVR